MKKTLRLAVVAWGSVGLCLTFVAPLLLAHQQMLVFAAATASALTTSVQLVTVVLYVCCFCASLVLIGGTALFLAEKWLKLPHSRTTQRRMLPNSQPFVQIPEGAPEAADHDQPDLEAVLETLPYNQLAFVFGMDQETGDLVQTTLPQAVHIQLVGASGQGKSRQATSVLTQLTVRNDAQHLTLALIDAEGETTAPFQQLPHVRYLADEPREAAKVLHALVSELERRDKYKIKDPVLLIFVEEFLNLRRAMPEGLRDDALEDYTTLALRGRKRGMFLFSVGQTAYVDKHIRDAQCQFLSSMAFAVKPSAARAAGFTNTGLLNKLYADRRPGQFLLEQPDGDVLLLAPYVDAQIVRRALLHEKQPGKQADDTEQTSEPVTDGIATLSPALQEKLAALLQQPPGTLKDTLMTIWGATPGSSKWEQARAEYLQCYAYMQQTTRAQLKEE